MQGGDQRNRLNGLYSSAQVTLAVRLFLFSKALNTTHSHTPARAAEVGDASVVEVLLKEGADATVKI